MQDLIAGRLDYQCEPMPTAMPQIQGQQRQADRASGAASARKVLPDLPTANEQGLTDFEVLSWNALFLPKGTPEPIVRTSQRGDDRGARHAVRCASGWRSSGSKCPDAGAAHAGVSREVPRERDQEMGGADQGERRVGRVNGA